ncbi:methyltransferase [Massilia oculi]|uniref:Methyltransferase n=2 Tax=Massilia oculi TaxID=945844 RepID=A0A2S2DL60_9BURK|nr:methyltransferase [Massilia oculi]
MQAWSDGYMTDVEYTFGYYAELNPLRTRLVMLNSGYAYPEIGTACELGFGQGLSINIHGAASSTEWYGTDFNPTQAAFAKDLSGDPARAARIFDDAFDAFCNRSDLPDFDFIGLHGIWSWVSDSNRAVIADFIRRKLKVGGVVYISYNTQPGWAAMAPLRDLLTGYSDTLVAPGTDTSQRIESALDFASRLLDTGAMYGRANPPVAEQLKQLSKHPSNYLAHEYFNRDWMPMPFSRMAEWMESQKLSFAGSAHYLDHVDALNMTADQATFLNEIPDRRFRETAMDFMVNQRFRRDYWIRGPRRLAPLEKAERLRAQRIVMGMPFDKVELKAKGLLVNADLKEDIYRPILKALSDYQPHYVSDIERAVAGNGVTLNHLLQALVILAGNGTVYPAQEDTAIQQARPATDALNARLCGQARYSTETSYLASPVTGGGMFVTRLEQLFMLARDSGLTQPGEWARFAADLLEAQNQRVLVEGKPVESLEQQLDELRKQAVNFSELRLDLLKGLAITS